MKNYILGAILSAVLIAILTVAVIGPAVANDIDEDNIAYVSNTYGGEVTLQLPQGVPEHPTTLFISASRMFKSSGLGEGDILNIWLWMPGMNSFIPVGSVSDNPNPETQEFIKTVFNGTSLWNPPAGMFNINSVADDELEVTKCGEVILVNLTVPVNMSLVFPEPIGNKSFTLPPIALEFRAFDSAYKEEMSMFLNPAQGFSGYTYHTKSVDKPAWVRTWIQTWTAGSYSAFTFTGTAHLYTTVTYEYPPPLT